MSRGTCCWMPLAEFANYIPSCSDQAEYQITWGPSPDDYTLSCSRHLGDMLTDANEHTITRWSEGASDAAAGEGAGE